MMINPIYADCKALCADAVMVYKPFMAFNLNHSDFGLQQRFYGFYLIINIVDAIRMRK